MRPTSDPGTDPESHTRSLGEGAARGTLRSLCSPATLTGGLTELAWVGAHALMYPLGTRTEQLRPDARVRPARPPDVITSDAYADFRDDRFFVAFA